MSKQSNQYKKAESKFRFFILGQSFFVINVINS